jgi:hypothetical protein
MGALVTYDGEHFRALTTHGYPEELAAMVRGPYLPNVRHQRLLDGERLSTSRISRPSDRDWITTYRAASPN